MEYELARPHVVSYMNRNRADLVVGSLVAGVWVVGGALTWQAYQQQQTFDEMGSMMGSSMGAVHGTNPLWYVLGTLLVSALVGGVYLVVRRDLPLEAPDEQRPSATTSGIEAEPSEPTVEGEADADEEEDTDPTSAEAQSRRVLDLLPEDERRILEPVLTSPGITQIELRDRADFSKSKVSQTVSALEKRGLLYRERQGRTYRIYPSDELEQSHTQ